MIWRKQQLISTPRGGLENCYTRVDDTEYRCSIFTFTSESNACEQRRRKALRRDWIYSWFERDELPPAVSSAFSPGRLSLTNNRGVVKSACLALRVLYAICRGRSFIVSRRAHLSRCAPLRKSMYSATDNSSTAWQPTWSSKPVFST